MKYRKKPVIIDAFQLTSVTLLKDMYSFFGVHSDNDKKPFHISWSEFGIEHLSIETLEGVMKASIGDYIIKGVNGEFYPCKPDIFEKTYDKVETE